MAIIWRSLGSVEPAADESVWRAFPFTATEELFRVSFSVGDWALWDEYIRGWIYLRWSYPSGPSGVSQIRKIWVQPEPTIVELMVPSVLLAEGIADRRFECFRRSSTRRGQALYFDLTTINATLEAGS